MDQEFEEKCMIPRQITQQPAVTKIDDEKERQRLSQQHHHNASYFLESAKNMLNSTTPLAAIILAYFAMEHKANQLLALHGYKVESHVCTQIGLSRIVGRKDLAKKLSDVFLLRQNIGYRLTLTQSEESKKEAMMAVHEIAIPFIEEIDQLIASML